MHILNSIFEAFVLGCSPYTFTRQLLMDTGFAYVQDQMMPMIHAQIVDRIFK